jgi:hypothetical protein
MDDRVSLNYEVKQLDTGELDLTYEIQNQENSDIYIFSPLTDYRGQDWVPLPQRVYVFWDRDGIIHLTKRLWPVPDDVEIYMPEVPFHSRVSPGGKLQEHVRLPVPLLVNFPYRSETTEKSHVGRAVKDSKGILFSIGYLSPKNDDVKVKPVPARPGNFTVSYGDAVQHQRILNGQPKALKVKVRG